MEVIEVEVLSENADGVREVRVLMETSTNPNPPPTNGEGIKGLRPSDKFAPMSVILVVNGNGIDSAWIADVNGEFKEV